MFSRPPSASWCNTSSNPSDRENNNLQTCAEVKKVEDAIITAQKGLSLAKLSLSDEVSLPPRPSYATQGKEIILRTNYFKLSSKPGLGLFRYNVEITPDENQKRKRRRIFELLWKNKIFHGVHATSDGGSTVISAKPLELQDDHQSIQITYYDQDQQGPHPKSKVYTLKIKMTGTISGKKSITPHYSWGLKLKKHQT